MSKALTAEIMVDGRDPLTPALAPNGRWLCYVLAPVGRTVITLTPNSGSSTPGPAPRRVE
jgi:hypothetical protein